MVRFIKSIFSYPPALAVIRWFDTEADIETSPTGYTKKVDWLRIVPLIILHLMCLGVVWVGWSWTAVIVAVLLYIVRMFAITGFYHRYFSHKAHIQNPSFLAVYLWGFGQCVGPARSPLVGRPSSPSSPLYGPGAGCPFPQSSWILVEPHRLVDLEGEFPDRI